MKRKCTIIVMVMVLSLFGCSTTKDISSTDQSKDGIALNKNEEVNSENLVSDYNTELAKKLISDTQPIEVDNELIEAFYDYYRDNPYELSMLPEFDEQKMPKRDAIATYVYLNSEDKTKTDYVKVFKDLLVGLDSDYYDVGNYEFEDETFFGENEPKIGYFRVKDVYKKSDEDTYVATFDALYFAELDLFEDYDFSSDNTKTIRDYKKTTEPLQSDELNKTIGEIFLRDDYDQIIEFSNTIEINFIIDEDNTPFIYKSCSVSIK